MARILITGGAGFIGSHLVEYHLNKGDEVWAIDNLFSGKEENIASFRAHPLFRFTQHDACIDDLSEPIEWAESVYHMGAIAGYKLVLKHPLKTLFDNIRACEHVLKQASERNPKIKILIASSSEVYGTDRKEKLREDLPLVISESGNTQRNYALSKMVNESSAFSFIEEKGLFISIARIFNTSGPRQSSFANYVLPNFVEKALAGEPLPVYGDGTQTRSFCSVRDTVCMLDLFLHHKNLNGQILNIGNDAEISIVDLAKRVLHVTASQSKIDFVPYATAYGRKFTDTMRRCPDLSKMKRLLGYTHRMSLDQIIEELASYTKLRRKK